MESDDGRPEIWTPCRQAIMEARSETALMQIERDGKKMRLYKIPMRCRRAPHGFHKG
jgi:hypothetical protein